MNSLRQNLESIQSDFDRIALLGDETWNYNTHYHKFLINQLPESCRRNILEIGCGTGEFSRLLSARAEKVLAVDLSPQMIRVAREKSKLYPNIDFVEGDAMTLQLPNEHFDCIATLTTLHHLPMGNILKKIRQALKTGGVFVCLDLYQRSKMSDWLLDGMAYPASLFFTFIKTGKPMPPKQVREAYAEHGKTDTYLALPEIRRVCAEILPGSIITRHLFWRYSLVWRKETDV